MPFSFCVALKHKVVEETSLFIWLFIYVLRRSKTLKNDDTTKPCYEKYNNRTIRNSLTAAPPHAVEQLHLQTELEEQ